MEKEKKGKMVSWSAEINMAEVKLCEQVLGTSKRRKKLIGTEILTTSQKGNRRWHNTLQHSESIETTMAELKYSHTPPLESILESILVLSLYRTYCDSNNELPSVFHNNNTKHPDKLNNNTISQGDCLNEERNPGTRRKVNLEDEIILKEGGMSWTEAKLGKIQIDLDSINEFREEEAKSGRSGKADRKTVRKLGHCTRGPTQLKGSRPLNRSTYAKWDPRGQNWRKPLQHQTERESNTFAMKTLSCKEDICLRHPINGLD